MQGGSCLVLEPERLLYSQAQSVTAIRPVVQLVSGKNQDHV